MCFLFEIHDELEVGHVFGFVGCSRERDIHMLLCGPLIEVIFDLQAMLATLEPNEVHQMLKTKLMMVSTNAIVAIGSALFSENSSV